MSQRKKLEQGRAEFAFQKAQEGSKSSKPSEYKSYVKKIPMLIKTNGLGATFAFINSKGGTYGLIYTQTKEWLVEQKKNTGIDFLNLGENIKDFELIEKIISLDSTSYRAATVEVLAFFNWLKRFADGLIDS